MEKTERVSFEEWCRILADALGFDPGEFKALAPSDRRSLLATAAGISEDDVRAMNVHALAERIRENGGEAPKAEAKPTPKAEAPKANPVDSLPKVDRPVVPAPTQGGAGDLLLAGLMQAIDARLQGFEPVKPEAIEAMVADAIAKAGGAPRVLEVRVPDKEPKKVEGHVHPIFDRVLKLAAMRLPIMLVGPAGCGKTTLARKVAEALGLPFGSVSCTAGMSEGELVGKLLPGEDGGFHYVQSQFVTLYEGGGVFLCDELDAADPNVLLKVNSAVGSISGRGFFHNDLRKAKPEVRQHEDSVLIAAANTYGTGANAQYVGRNQLDAATLDRFTVLEMDYDRDLERQLGDPAVCSWVWTLRDRAADAKLRRVISTRMIEKGTAMMAAGFKLPEVQEMLLTGWTADERAKVNA